MLNRRLFVGGLAASVPLIHLPGAARAQARLPQLHAMVVGIDQYRLPIKSLNGCVNDAEDLEARIKPLATSVRTLIGRKGGTPVTKADFLRDWNGMLAAAREGDTLLLTFSGHGSQIPVLPNNPSNEPDLLDETLVLSNYAPRDPRERADHIIDDEINGFANEAHKRGLILVFIADCCHSGGATRQVLLRDVSYRMVDPSLRGIERTGPAPVTAPQPIASTAQGPPGLLFIAGSQENELVPEIPIDGKPRGVLSVAAARALRGGAARGDGVITAAGLTSFVFQQVEALSDSSQHADVTWPTITDRTSTVTGDTPIIVMRGPQQEQAIEPTAQTGPVRLRIQGLAAAERSRIRLQGATVVGEQDEASLVWDARTKRLLNAQRNMAAENLEASQLQHAVDCHIALERLTRMSAGNALSLRIRLPGDLPNTPPTAASDLGHKPKATFDVVVGRTENDVLVGAIPDNHYFVLFNLTGNGKVQMLEPYPGRQPNFDRPAFKTGIRKERGASPHLIPGFVVQEQGPFGAEHIVAVAGPTPLKVLMPALQEAHERFAVAAVMEALANEAKVQQRLRVGFKGIYTER